MKSLQHLGVDDIFESILAHTSQVEAASVIPDFSGVAMYRYGALCNTTNQVPRYVHRDLCYAAMAKYVALHNATYLAIATVFGPKNQELLMWVAVAGYTPSIRIYNW